MYAITDIETTGGSERNAKITEISIFLFDGEKIVNEFTSLINPESFIPVTITQLTGISNEMVQNAPKFYEVAKEIVDITQGATFVAHNVNFDYKFIKEEFKQLGFNWNMPRMCTVKLSRKHLPGYSSYSLGNLCKELDIPINGRHRARGDAEATVILFKEILKRSFNEPLQDHNWINQLPDTLTKKDIDELPNEAGVYYFYSESKELLYIGKSKQIRTRVLSHLGNIKTKKAISMKEKIAHISVFLTGNDLMAQLLESEEIKNHLPVYNVSQKRKSFNWTILMSYDIFGYINLSITKTNGNHNAQFPNFSSKEETKSFLNNLVQDFELCTKLCGLDVGSGNSCFQYNLNRCKGACIAKEPHEEYNKRVNMAINKYRFKSRNFILTAPTQHKSIKSYVLVKDYHFLGFGYTKSKIKPKGIKQLTKGLIPARHSKDVVLILQRFFKENSENKAAEFISLD